MGNVRPIEPLWTVEQVADFLQVPVKTLYQWRHHGYGPSGRRVGRYIRYRAEDVRAWVDSLDEQSA
ncbi:helix-turn-helix transcriptional regulator [Amycolatopsis pithecellobii]|uniref:Helix-turn-helix domain-containing protein n=1 Tax=Amycolatopsis pithecellobii TaxID=664692 RepID=A0A6N7ZAX3_9PSEU|nr:helix-turn-helix domain-containing protein [Amycolatopsis pithecellobii]MTD58825.1 helix-turn-helix domain-containing protein [Amycolatopsis pithecellobii]